MKKLFAATLAAILILSAAGCAKKPVQQEEPAAPVQEEAIVPEAPAEAEKSQDNVIHITPNQNQTQDGLEASWLDEPERIQTDLEEIVSCTYTLPHLTLEVTTRLRRRTPSLMSFRRPSFPMRRRRFTQPRRKRPRSATSTAATAFPRRMERSS